MRPWLVVVLALVAASVVWAHEPWRQDFRSMPEGWELRTVPRTKVAEFRADPAGADGAGVLVMEADNASATLATQAKKVDLARLPILRWRWRVLEFPRGADGRDGERDDQAIGIYVSYGGILGQRSIAYRWETNTPVGSEGEASYAAVQRNAMKVWRGEGAFLDFLKADPEITLSDAELEDLFDLEYHFKNVDRIFARVFGEDAHARAAAE